MLTILKDTYSLNGERHLEVLRRKIAFHKRGKIAGNIRYPRELQEEIAVLYKNSGCKPGNLAKSLGVSPLSLQHWSRKHERFREVTIVDSKTSPNPEKITENDRAEIRIAKGITIKLPISALNKELLYTLTQLKQGGKL